MLHFAQLSQHELSGVQHSCEMVCIPCLVLDVELGYMLTPKCSPAVLLQV